MQETKISVPELMLVASTRVVLGIGIGLLVAGRMKNEERKAVGRALTIVGGLITIPIALEVLGGGRLRISEEKPSEEASVA